VASLSTRGKPPSTPTPWLRVEGGFELDAEFTRYDPLVGGCAIKNARAESMYTARSLLLIGDRGCASLLPAA